MTTVAQARTLDDMPWQDPPPESMPPENLLEDDGDKMELPWHGDTIHLLKAGYIASQGGKRETYYIGGNMFLYYSKRQIRNQDFKGPDLFVVKDVDGTVPRPYWAIWDEDGRFPDVIVELLSPSTRATDLHEKKQLYERTFRTSEYFCAAPEAGELYGWRLNTKHYEPISPNEQGWLWSEELGLWLGTWSGVFMTEERSWLRWYHENGDLVLLAEEAERQRAENAEEQVEAERQRAENAEEQVEAERQRAETAEEHAEAERQRAEAERQRAEAAEERAAQLAAKLRALGIDPDTTDS